jgi:hypothetical protein
MTEFPTLLYKCPGPWSGNGYTFGSLPVEDEAGLSAALSDGWHRTVPEAVAAQGKAPAKAVSPTSEPEPDLDLTSPPTREEMERQAGELGIRFDGRTGDKTLMKRIEEALNGVQET